MCWKTVTFHSAVVIYEMNVPFSTEWAQKHKTLQGCHDLLCTWKRSFLYWCSHKALTGNLPHYISTLRLTFNSVCNQRMSGTIQSYWGHEIKVMLTVKSWKLLREWVITMEIHTPSKGDSHYSDLKCYIIIRKSDVKYSMFN